LLFVLELTTLLRNYYQFYFKRAPALHNQRVAHIQAQVGAWAKGDRKTKMVTGRPGWQAMSLRVGKYKQTQFKVQLDLHDIL